MDESVSPHNVANAFVLQYYKILSVSPQSSFGFYKESSLLSWPDCDGVLASVTTLSAINEKILSSHFKNMTIELNTVDAQASQDGGVIVAVTGSFVKNDRVANIFFQTFFLAKQEAGFFVLNDNLRLFDAFGSISDAANNLAVQTSANCSKSLPTEKDENQVEKIEEAVEDSAAISSSSPSPSPSPAVSGEEAAQVPSTAAKTLPKVDSSVVPPKMSYASMVAKEAPVLSPKAVITPKAALVTHEAPLQNGTAKSSSNVSKSQNGTTKSSSNVSKLQNGTTKSSSNVSKSPAVGKNTPQDNSLLEARRVFVGGLPYEITEEVLKDALKEFGPISRYPNAIQIRKHEDGFCLAFVEFELADSARRAVEVHHVKIGEKEAYIAHKRSTSGGASFRNGNGNRSYNDRGRSMGSRQNRSYGNGARKASRDLLN